MKLPRSDVRRRWREVLVVVAVCAYSWIAAGFRPFTLAEEIMVAVPALVVLVASFWPSRVVFEPAAVLPPQSSRGSIALWLGLVVVAVVWELIALFSSPRSDHPTLSTITDEVMSVQAGRALVFALWLALGWLLVTSTRTAPRAARS